MRIVLSELLSKISQFIVNNLIKNGVGSYLLSSTISTLVDKAVYYLLFTPLGTLKAQYIARAMSSLLNFNLNRFFVFKSKDDYWKAFGKYYCLCIPQVLIESFILKKLIEQLNVESAALATALNFLVQMVIFCISYLIQKKWVFNTRKEEMSDEKSKGIN